MDQKLVHLKSEFTKRFLGTHGIHGVGIREIDNAICLYLDPDSKLESTPEFESIVHTAAPFTIVLIREEAPKRA